MILLFIYFSVEIRFLTELSYYHNYKPEFFKFSVCFRETGLPSVISWHHGTFLNDIDLRIYPVKFVVDDKLREVHCSYEENQDLHIKCSSYI